MEDVEKFRKRLQDLFYTAQEIFWDEDGNTMLKLVKEAAEVTVSSTTTIKKVNDRKSLHQKYDLTKIQNLTEKLSKYCVIAKGNVENFYKIMSAFESQLIKVFKFIEEETGLNLIEMIVEYSAIRNTINELKEALAEIEFDLEWDKE